jgi:hypothetical protein
MDSVDNHFSPRQSTSTTRGLGTRLLLRQGATRTHNTRLYLLDGIGLGTMWFGNLCYLLRRSGQGFPGISNGWRRFALGRKCGRQLQAGLDGRMRIISPRAELHPVVSDATCSRRGPCDNGGMQARRSRLDLRQWLVLGGFQEQRSVSCQRHAYIVRSSRHEMLESIPPWMAAGLLTTCKHAHLVVC